MGVIGWSASLVIAYIVSSGSAEKDVLVIDPGLYGFGSNKSSRAVPLKGSVEILLSGPVVLVWGSDELIVGSRVVVKRAGRAFFLSSNAVLVSC